jgi:hypothetical protein
VKRRDGGARDGGEADAWKIFQNMQRRNRRRRTLPVCWVGGSGRHVWIWDGAGVGWMHEEGRLIGSGGSLMGRGLRCARGMG